MILLSAGVVLSLAGCQKDPSAQLNGKAVLFTASSSSPKAETRTVFSGDGTPKKNSNNEDMLDEFGRKILTWERIDWKPGDQVMIASDKATVYGSDQKYATYTVASVSSSEDGKRSLALLDEKDGSEELFFNNESSYSFWGVYPAPENGNDIVNGIAKFTIAADQSSFGTPEIKNSTDGTKTLTILQPNMSQAVMLGKEMGATQQEVDIKFYPAFTAFEFTLMAKDSDIDLKSLVIESSKASNEESNKALTGAVTATILSGEDESGRGKSTYSIEHSSTKSITYNFPANTQITKTKYLTFTILALPEDITGLTLEFHMGADGNQVQKATLKQNGNAITFAGCRKHCLRGIAVKGGWQFELGGQVLDWIPNQAKTNFSENVQAKPFTIVGATETGNHEEAAHGYERYYQLRTLNMNVQNPHFNVTFTPMAPLGGYWTLNPQSANVLDAQGGMEGFEIRIFDGEEESTAGWSSGQIMNQPVELRIYPKADRDKSKEYRMIILSFFSPNKSGDPSYSADSEIQDVHGDGRYSYWTFVIPATE